VDRVLAIVGLRARTLFRRYRSASDLARLAGSALSLLLAGGLAIGLAIGFGVMTHMLARGGDESMMRLGFMVTFYSFLFFGAILPLVMGVSNQGFDVAPFRLFPIGRPKLYSITLAAYAASPEQLLYYPALVSVTLTGVVFAGVNIPIGLTLIGLLLLFYVAWGNAALLFLVGIMRRRRIREVLVMIAFMVLIAASLVPSLIIDPATDSIDQSGPVIGLLTRLAVGLGKFLPPGLAAQGLTGLYISGVGAALPGLLLLAFWDLAGIALGYGAFLRYHLGAPESAASPSRAIRADTQRSARHRLFSADSPLLAFVPPETRAVAAKEMRYLLRSVVGKFNLIMMPLFVIIVVFFFARAVTSSFLGLSVDSLLLFGLLLYATLFSNNFVNNAFAWEGDGVRTYFWAPLRPEHVLAGKNLAVWAYNTLLLLIVIAAWSILKRLPDLATLSSAVLLYGSAVLFFTMVGNVVSVLFPVRRDISSITNSPSQIAILISLASLSAAVSLVAATLLLADLSGKAYLRPIFLLALLLILGWCYRLTLGLAGRLMEQRKEKLIDALGGSD
jgi:hypothetical protein